MPDLINQSGLMDHEAVAEHSRWRVRHKSKDMDIAKNTLTTKLTENDAAVNQSAMTDVSLPASWIGLKRRIFISPQLLVDLLDIPKSHQGFEGINNRLAEMLGGAADNLDNPEHVFQMTLSRSVNPDSIVRSYAVKSQTQENGDIYLTKPDEDLAAYGPNQIEQLRRRFVPRKNSLYLWP